MPSLYRPNDNRLSRECSNSVCLPVWVEQRDSPVEIALGNHTLCLVDLYSVVIRLRRINPHVSRITLVGEYRAQQFFERLSTVQPAQQPLPTAEIGRMVDNIEAFRPGNRMCFFPPHRRPMPRPRWLPRRGYPAIRDNCLHTPSRPRRERLPNGYSGRQGPRAKQTRQSISSRHRNGRRHRSASIYRRFYRASHRCFGNRDASRTYRVGNRLSMLLDPSTRSSNRNRAGPGHREQNLFDLGQPFRHARYQCHRLYRRNIRRTQFHIGTKEDARQRFTLQHPSRSHNRLRSTEALPIHFS